MQLKNRLYLLDIDKDTLQDVVSKFNHNMTLLPTVNDLIAGEGLRLEGRTLLLSVDTTFVRADNGQLLGVAEVLQPNDQSVIKATGTVQEILDSLATSIKQIKGTASWDEPTETFNLQEILHTLQVYQENYDKLLDSYGDLQQDYLALKDKYEELAARTVPNTTNV